MYKKCLPILLIIIFLTSCSENADHGKLKKVGLLVPETISDQVWGTKGYKGMLNIQSRFNVDVYYKEGIDSEIMVDRAVKDFKQKGVNLIFGHGSEYAPYFNKIAHKYPKIHFVCFNGDATEKNTTSLNFKGHAMGFFGGMTAAHMTKTKQIGIIAAFDWQPEVKGFIEGAKAEDKNVQVNVKYVNNWDDRDTAIRYLNDLISQGVDVVYPAGDGYNVPVIEQLKSKGLYAIGYVSDQSDLGESTVLTSTVQHVPKLYELVAQKFSQGKLKSGNLTFDFPDDVISMGTYSHLVDQPFEEKINQLISTYKNTGKLPKPH
ncbi:BMP family ABC transporter substrate-binding protein [Falsibacillus albus]|uniref:BMP family ABC transporter substrate-binding protein n=1 Tax=Falsibacillus albus TaxID=2478915 RepID=A0A3L7K3I6_9BACI|nr:BMP family ABC transporter substrate-binding protein [Falsibacillus albus]RLQ97205.1 BMP family ABC transporter substrate-binding protein [Falsibacillus albus]